MTETAKVLPIETPQIDLSLLQQQIDCKWRVQKFNKGKKPFAILVPYIDSRDAQKILDSVVGVANWQSRHKDVNGKVYCEVGLFINGNWIWKSDVGAESAVEKSKGEASDSFKRACVQWGVGRFLYDMNPVKVQAIESNGKFYPYMKAKNKAVYDGGTLTKMVNYYINNGNLNEENWIVQ